MIEPVQRLSEQLDSMPDAIVLATADAVLEDWREQIPEVNRAQLARVLLVTYASGGWAPRRDVETRIKRVEAAE